MKEFEHLEVRHRADWRQWLADNHHTATGVWLIMYKKDSGKLNLTYDEAVEEALCFGWIDSKPNKIDEYSFKQFYAPRNPKSGWSKVNKIRIEQLLANNLMMPAGLAAIERAKQNGTWEKLDAIENLEMPADLLEALTNNPPALDYWDAFPRSVKRGILEWISNAKRPETRANRINETAEKAMRNERAAQWSPK